MLGHWAQAGAQGSRGPLRLPTQPLCWVGAVHRLGGRTLQLQPRWQQQQPPRALPWGAAPAAAAAVPQTARGHHLWGRVGWEAWEALWGGQARRQPSCMLQQALGWCGLAAASARRCRWCMHACLRRVHGSAVGGTEGLCWAGAKTVSGRGKGMGSMSMPKPAACGEAPGVGKGPQGNSGG